MTVKLMNGYTTGKAGLKTDIELIALQTNI